MGKIVNQVKSGVSLTHAFKFHREKRKAKGEKTVSQSEFKKVLNLFNKMLGDRVLSGFHTQLPHNMGIIRIIGHKGDVDHLAIDFKATKEAGTTIYFDNRHTDGHWFEWNWNKSNYLVRNLKHYTFTPTRGNMGNSLKEKLGAVLKTPGGYKRYMIV